MRHVKGNIRSIVVGKCLNVQISRISAIRPRFRGILQGARGVRAPTTPDVGPLDAVGARRISGYQTTLPHPLTRSGYVTGPGRPHSHSVQPPRPRPSGGRVTVRATIRGLAARANPAFAAGVVLVPLAALGYVSTVGTLQQHTYVHVMAGVLWTGIDLFMAMVLGPVIGSLALEDRADVFSKLTPKTSFLLPSLAAVTIVGGITLALRIPAVFEHAHVWLAIFTAVTLVPTLVLIGWQFDAFRDWRWQAWFGVVLVGAGSYLAATLPDFAWTEPVFAVALAIVAGLSVLGFGVLMPGEVRMCKEMITDDPDAELIGAIGMRNAKLAGVQGLMQLAVVASMVYIRYDGF